MIRIVDGVAYESFSTEHFKLKAYDCGHGHLEISASRQLGWRELDWDSEKVRWHLQHLDYLATLDAEEKAARNAARAAARAKKTVRRLCKAMGVDTMLTLTYKANQLDLVLTKKHLREFNRRLVRLIPDFAFVAAFERQDRGAWHVHMATRSIPQSLADGNRINAIKVKSYDLIRRIWRSVVGDLGGNIDVARRKFHSQRSSAQIASYIAGYIVKEFSEGDKWVNRWTKYGDVVSPQPVELGLFFGPVAVIEAAYALLPASSSVAFARLHRFKDWFVLHLEPSSPHLLQKRNVLSVF